MPLPFVLAPLLVSVLLLPRPATAEPCEAPAPTASSLRVRPVGLASGVLELGLRAYRRARCRGEVQRERLAIIDYSLPSSARRLWVLDVGRGELLFRDWVSHGRGSGEELARVFSNVPQSLTSSLGVFRTASTYHGKHGLSLILEGLEPGINDRARERAIVIHGADYASARHVARHGRLGRSWGCPAVPRQSAPAIIDSLRDGALVFAYYPSTPWLSTSVYVANP